MVGERVGKYEMGKMLAEGEFAKVHLALDTDTNESVAIKVFSLEVLKRKHLTDRLSKEISILKMVKHKNVLQMLEMINVDGVFLVMELASGGELFDSVVEAGKLNEEQARFYFQQLVEGINHCHKLGVCHRDLKLEGNLKISGFGMSALYAGIGAEVFRTVNTTPDYTAPEVIFQSNGQGYDAKKADVWSCGVILYVLLAGYLPFDSENTMVLLYKIKAANFTHPDWFSAEVRSLLDRMIVADPSVRASLVEVERHPWYFGLDEVEMLNVLHSSGSGM